MLENGEVPAIEQMINNGVMGNLATLQPVLSPMLWNSIATGKRPYKHGIHGFTEVNPHTNVVGPSLSTSRTCKAIWNMLSQEGYKTHVVNWFASHPAEPINGTCISEFYSSMPKKFDEPWIVGNDVVHPADKKDFYQDLRLHPTELEGQILQMFAPAIHELDQTKDARVKVLANLIAEAITIHNATTPHHGERGLGFCGRLLRLHRSLQPRLHALPSTADAIRDGRTDFRIFQDVIPNVYRFHGQDAGPPAATGWRRCDGDRVFRPRIPQ